MDGKTQMNDVEKFIQRVDRLQRRYERSKYPDTWLIPREELMAVRDELKQPGLKFDTLETTA